MTLKWFTGFHGTPQSNYFVDDKVANEMRNARKVNQTLDFFYDKYKEKTDLTTASVIDFDGSWGLNGPFISGLDPIEQFIGSCNINIYLNEDGLKFNIINRKSLTSATFHIWPNSWNWSEGQIGNFD